MLNVMAALPNIGGALCLTPQCWMTPTTRVPCSNDAKMQNLLKFAGVPQTRQQISAVRRSRSLYAVARPSAAAEIRRGKKIKIERRKKPQRKNIMACPIS